MVYCTNCRNLMQENQDICPRCAVSMRRPKGSVMWKFCRECGYELYKMSERCTKCGNNIPCSELQISDIIINYNKINGICSLDYRADNRGESEVMINHVKFKVLETITLGSTAYLKFSKTYGLDISQLRQEGDTIDYPVAQVISPRKTDRFELALNARTIGLGNFKYWKLETKLCTNFGDVIGKPIEIWLPFQPIPQHFIDKCEKKFDKIMLLIEQNLKLDEKNLDFNIWKSETIKILEDIFGKNNQRIKQIENIKSSNVYNPIRQFRKILYVCIDESVMQGKGPMPLIVQNSKLGKVCLGESDDINLDEWKSSTITILEDIFGKNDQKIKQIEDIKVLDLTIEEDPIEQYSKILNECIDELLS